MATVTPDTTPRSLRRRVDAALRPRPDGSLPFGLKLIVVLIVLAVLAGILGTEPTVRSHPLAGPVLALADRVFLAAFAIEFALRLWCAGERERFRGPGGRLRWLLRPTSLIDLAVIVLLGLSLSGGDAFVLRLVRLVRIVALARIAILTPTGNAMAEALRERMPELVLTLAVAVLAILVSAVALHLAEGAAQPDAFGSVPRALWWAVATLTTVGYGDTFPVTALGRLVAGIVAILGIGVIALPTGILAAAFSDALQRQRRRDDRPT